MTGEAEWNPLGNCHCSFMNLSNFVWLKADISNSSYSESKMPDISVTVEIVHFW